MGDQRVRAARALTMRWALAPIAALVGAAAVATPAIAASSPESPTAPPASPTALPPGATALPPSATALPPSATSSSPTIVVRGDSLLVTNLPSSGQTTVEATRPDALTGAPVVIGFFSGTADQSTPFSVNTTTPTPLSPGDCWQSGALSQALTPDLQPGDTVTVSQVGPAGGSPNSTSVAVQAGSPGGTQGPAAGCSDVAPWGRNAITSGPATVSNGALTVAGVAQPLASGVSVSATDGTHTTAPVATTPAADGTWSATLPASQLSALHNGTLTVRPVFTVPDVSTGAQAHIAGVNLTLTKFAQAAPTTPVGASPRPGGAGPKGSAPRPRVHGLRTGAPQTLASARRNGIRVSFIVPAGTSLARIQLLRGNERLFLTVVHAHKAGSRQVVVLRSRRLSRALTAGRYMLAVQAGSNGATLGPITARPLQIR
jgi:hypothetical protein